MATTIWKGHLTFGLISVPVKLFAAARSETVGFNQLHAPCRSRIKQQTFCPTCNRTVERKELVKGYEFEADRYVIMDETDLEKIVPPSGRTLEVMEFVSLDEVDPVYFNTSYYLVPEQAGEKAYALLTRALEHSKYAGIAKVTMHQWEHIVIVRPSQGGLMLHTIYYADEVRHIEEYGQSERINVQEKEMELAQVFIRTLAAPFDPEKYRDQYRENVLQLIQAKAMGAEVQVAQAPVLDLMAALKASIERTPTGPGTPSAAPPPPPAPTPEPEPMAEPEPEPEPVQASAERKPRKKPPVRIQSANENEGLRQAQ